MPHEISQSADILMDFYLNAGEDEIYILSLFLLQIIAQCVNIWSLCDTLQNVACTSIAVHEYTYKVDIKVEIKYVSLIKQDPVSTQLYYRTILRVMLNLSCIYGVFKQILKK